jgi:hypothetical protein
MQILTLASLSLIALITPATLAQAPSQTFTIDPAEVTLTTKGEKALAISIAAAGRVEWY